VCNIPLKNSVIPRFFGKIYLEISGFHFLHSFSFFSFLCKLQTKKKETAEFKRFFVYVQQ
jgi:hypothetical protein